MVKRNKAFSLVELVIIVLFLSILAAVALPRMNFALISKQKAETLAIKIVTDLRRTRSLAILNAANNTDGFELNMKGPVIGYTTYTIENLDTRDTLDTHTIDSAIKCTGGKDFEFGPLGNLLTGSDTQLTVSAEGKTVTITIIPATGTIKCAEN